MCSKRLSRVQKNIAVDQKRRIGDWRPLIQTRAIDKNFDVIVKKSFSGLLARIWTSSTEEKIWAERRKPMVDSKKIDIRIK
jgi:hypothetical protein